MSTFVFPGHPAYLLDAAGHLGRPEAARGAGGQAALTALANLCAQASRSAPSPAEAILLKAVEFRDQLAVALHAANAMIADVEGALGTPPRDLGLPPAGPGPAAPRRGRGGPARPEKGGDS